MNILIVTHYFHPENFRINDLAIELKNKNHKVSVLTPIPNYPEGKFYVGYGIFRKRKEYWNGINIYRSLLIPRGAGSNISLAISWISSILGNLFTSLFILNNSFDLIFVFGPSPFTICLPAIFIKKIKRIPICFWVQDLWPESVSSAGKLKTVLLPKLLMPLVKFTYNNCDMILVSSPGFIKSIADKEINRRKIKYFPQWAEPVFKPISSTDKKLPGVPENSFVIMFAGNIGEAQDFESIIKAAHKLSEHKTIHWVIIGSGRKEKWVKENILKLCIEDVFHMIGKYPIKKMPEFYSQASAMLISLKREYIFSLTIPAKLQTYLASAKPVIAMIDGATAELVRESKSGLVCNSGNADQLANNVLRMSEMTDYEIKRMATNAHNLYMKEFNRDVLLNRLESIFFNLKNGL